MTDTTAAGGRRDDGPATPSLRFGVLLGTRRLAAWQVRCIEHLTTVPGVLPAVVLIATPTAPPRRTNGGSGRIADIVLGRWIEPELEPSFDVADILPGVPRIESHVPRSGGGTTELPNTHAGTVRELNLDLLLHLGFDTLRGDVLFAPRHGVWSFRYGKADGIPSQPPCFWELYEDDDVIRVTLDRLGNGRPGEVLKQGWFRVLKHSYAKSLRGVFEGSSRWPAQVCAELLNGGHDMPASPVARLPREERKSPSALQILRLGVGLLRNAVDIASRSLLRHEVWNLGITDEPIEALIVPGASRGVRWFPEIADGKFLADPFPVYLDGILYVLCEEFDYREYRGRIVSVEVTEDGVPLSPKPALDLGMHLSYPCVVVHNGAIFCVPEAVDSGEISLYRAEDFPSRWEKEAVLVEGFSGVDSTIFRHEGLWWLAATNFLAGKQDTLWLWYAEGLRGPWRPHAANPVKTDVRSARPGGTPFVSEGQLYRPAQDCSRTYGGRVVINRVETLTPTRFLEMPVSWIDPDNGGAYPDGLHTASSAGGTTVVDGRRLTFVREAAQHTLRTGARYARRGTRGFVGRSVRSGGSVMGKDAVVD